MNLFSSCKYREREREKKNAIVIDAGPERPNDEPNELVLNVSSETLYSLNELIAGVNETTNRPSMDPIDCTYAKETRKKYPNRTEISILAILISNK